MSFSNSQDAQPSLALEILVSCHWRFAVFFFFASIVTFVFKRYRYYYPDYLMGWEFTPVFLYAFVESTRLLMVSRGNKMRAMSSLCYSMVWAIPIITMHAYYIDLQTYILRADLVINSLALALTTLEVLLCSLKIYNIYTSAQSY